jgi:hypothetical protein
MIEKKKISIFFSQKTIALFSHLHEIVFVLDAKAAGQVHSVGMEGELILRHDGVCFLSRLDNGSERNSCESLRLRFVERQRSSLGSISVAGVNRTHLVRITSVEC